MRSRLLPVLSVIALFALGLGLASCGGAEDPSGTVTGEITIGSGTEGTLPGGQAAGGGGGGQGTGGQGTGEEGSEKTGTGEEEGAEQTGTEGGQAGGDVDPGEDGGGRGPQGDATKGKAVFTGAGGCGSCHALEDAGTNGQVGPNLNEAKPDYERALSYVTNGQGGMPAFKGRLSDEDIANVSAYVVTASGGGGK
jgi:mono/diheme cytochrome c family protein